MWVIIPDMVKLPLYSIHNAINSEHQFDKFPESEYAGNIFNSSRIVQVHSKLYALISCL